MYINETELNDISLIQKKKTLKYIVTAYIIL